MDDLRHVENEMYCHRCNIWYEISAGCNCIDYGDETDRIYDQMRDERDLDDNHERKERGQ